MVFALVAAGLEYVAVGVCQVVALLVGVDPTAADLKVAFIRQAAK